MGRDLRKVRGGKRYPRQMLIKMAYLIIASENSLGTLVHIAKVTPATASGSRTDLFNRLAYICLATINASLLLVTVLHAGSILVFYGTAYAVLIQ